MLVEKKNMFLFSIVGKSNRIYWNQAKLPNFLILRNAYEYHLIITYNII